MLRFQALCSNALNNLNGGASQLWAVRGFLELIVWMSYKMSMTQITPLQIKNHLAPSKNLKPHFAVSLKKSGGETLEVSDPKAIRSLISLMDMNAVLGGAASHYGGPAALAEMWSVLHAVSGERSMGRLTSSRIWSNPVRVS